MGEFGGAVGWHWHYWCIGGALPPMHVQSTKVPSC
jgi:hypothetical protein